MPRSSRKEKVKQIGEYALIALLGILVLVLLWAVWGIAQKEERARKAADDQAEELEILRERKQVLETNLNELSTDRGQEGILRQNHGVAKDGEEVIIVVPQDDEVLEPHLPWYKRFLGFFGIW